MSFLVVGIGLLFALRFVLDASGVGGLPVASLVFVVALLAICVVAQRTFVGSSFASVGLRRFVDWTRRERMYFFQVIPLARVWHRTILRHRLLAIRKLVDPGGDAWHLATEYDLIAVASNPSNGRV